MKESDVKDIINLSENLKEAHNNSGEAEAAGYTKLYENCSDIASRLKFLVVLNNSIELKNKTKNKPSDKEVDEKNRLVERFIKDYISNGNEKTHKLIFENLGRLKTESDYDLLREYDIRKKDVKDKDVDSLVGAKWLADNSGVGVENKAIEVFLAAMSYAFNTDKKVKDYYKKNNLLSGNNKRVEDYLRLWKKNGENTFYVVNNLKSSVAASIDEMKSKKYDEKTEDIIRFVVKRDGREKRLQNKAERDAKKYTIYFEELYKQGKKELELNENRIIDGIRSRYHKAATMEDKLDVLVDCCVESSLRSKEYRNAAAADFFVYDMIDYFADEYVGKADCETAKKQLFHLGKKVAENIVCLVKLDKEYRAEFESEGKNGIKKADALAWISLEGQKAGAYKNLIKSLSTKLKSDSQLGNSLWINADITLDTTIEEYAAKIGVKETDIERYIEQNKAKPGDKIINVLFSEGDRKDKDVAKVILKDRFLNDLFNIMVGNGIDTVTKALDKDDNNLFIEINGKINTEISFSGISDWLDNEGKERYDGINTTTIGRFKTRNKQIDKKKKNFDNYIKLHTGNDICETDHLHQKDCLLKAIAADALKYSGIKFSVESIHALAEGLKDTPAYLSICDDRDAVRKALSSPDNLHDDYVRLFGVPYKVESDKVKDYIDDMDKLARNMMTSEGRSREYKAFAKAVRQIADLKVKYDFNYETDRNAAALEVVGLNMALLASGQIYMKGKEKVRTTGSGRERFDNALDGLAIISQYVTGVKEFVDKEVSGINAIRKAQAGSKDFVKLSDHGAGRAETAKKLRENAAKKNKSSSVKK